MGSYIRYLHHGQLVFVRTELKGKHREFSLCHDCQKEGECAIIAVVFKLCELIGLTLPVLECPDFEERNNLCVD